MVLVPSTDRMAVQKPGSLPEQGLALLQIALIGLFQRLQDVLGGVQCRFVHSGSSLRKGGWAKRRHGISPARLVENQFCP